MTAPILRMEKSSGETENGAHRAPGRAWPDLGVGLDPKPGSLTSTSAAPRVGNAHGQASAGQGAACKQESGLEREAPNECLWAA